jgi:hypothetical protein
MLAEIFGTDLIIVIVVVAVVLLIGGAPTPSHARPSTTRSSRSSDRKSVV